MSENAIPQTSKKDVIKGILFFLVVAYLAVNLVVWYVEQANPESGTNRKANHCRAQADAEVPNSWGDPEAWLDAVDDCENGP